MKTITLLQQCCDLYFEKYKCQSIKTLEHKKYVIHSFIDSISNDVTQITSSDIHNWQKQFNVSENTLNGNLTILRQFLMFSESQGLKTEMPVIPKYIDEYIPHLFSQDELCSLIYTADNNISYSNSASTKTVCIPMIIRILACCGTRLEETISLQWKDYDENTGILYIKNSKGKKERYVPIHYTLNELLKCYKKSFQKKYGKSEYLFPNNTLTEHINKNQFEYEFTKICKKANLTENKLPYSRGICAHCLRHTFTVESFRVAIDNNIDITDTIPVLSTYLGHAHLKETEKYLKFSYDMFENAEVAFSEYSSSVFDEVML